MSTIGFARFNKQFASGGITTALSDAQAAAGWAFLGTSPPTVEEFNAMMQSFDDKDNYLFGNLSTLATNAGVSAPADGDFTTLYKAVVALLVSGVAPVALTGTSAAYVLANALPVAAYVNGQKFRATVNVTSAANATLKVDALAAIPIYGRGAAAIQAGEMPVNSIATFEILISATVNGGSPVAILGQAAGGPLQVATATQSLHAVTLAQMQAAQGNYANVLALSANTVLTAAQMSGNAIEWYGASGGTLTLPTIATIGGGKFTKFYNYGAGTLTIQTNGTSGDFIYNGLVITNTSIVLQRGDDLEVVARASSQELDIVGGTAVRQYYPLTVSSAVSAQQAAVFGQLPGALGSILRGKADVAAAATTLTYTADQVIAGTANNGLLYPLSNINATLNLATTGVGGMDTGTATANTPIGIYLMYNPNAVLSGTNPCLVGHMEGAAALTDTYTYGAAALAAYTVSALVGVGMISATVGQFVNFKLRNRWCYVGRTQMLNVSTAAAASTSFTTGAYPKSAIEIQGDISCSSTGSASNVSMAVGPDGAGTANSPGMIFPTYYQVGQVFYKIPITSQIFYYYFQQSVAGTFGGQVNLSGWSF